MLISGQRLTSGRRFCAGLGGSRVRRRRELRSSAAIGHLPKGSMWGVWHIYIYTWTLKALPYELQSVL